MSKQTRTKPLTAGQKFDALVERLHTRWWNFRWELGHYIGGFTRASRAGWRSQGWR